MVNFFRDEFAYRGLLGEPLTGGTGDRVPADVNGAGRVADAGRSRRDHIGLASKAERLLGL